MRKSLILAALCALALPPTSPAKTFRLNWNERKALQHGSMTFHVGRIVVGAGAWKVTASFRNRSPFPVTVTTPTYPYCFGGETGFGICFPPGAPSLQRSDGYGALFARFFSPHVPPVIRPHRGWSGSFRGTGVLPRHLYLSVGFGLFTQFGRTPFGWVTTHTFRL